MSVWKINFYKFLNLKKGFTLIELLVVISIISLLSSIVFTALSGAKTKARDAARVTSVQEIAKAFILIADNNNGIFPSTGGIAKCLGTSGTCWAGFTSGDATLNASLLSFLSKIPTDPSGRSGKGDRYLYADQSSTVAWHCDGSSYPTGPFVIWVPEDTSDPVTDSKCKNVGFSGCCASVSCSEGYFCAYKIVY